MSQPRLRFDIAKAAIRPGQPESGLWSARTVGQLPSLTTSSYGVRAAGRRTVRRLCHFEIPADRVAAQAFHLEDRVVQMAVDEVLLGSNWLP